MGKELYFVAFLFVITGVAFAPPVKEEETAEANEVKVEHQIDELGLEYGRYLQQVVEALEQDKEFSKKLENVSHDDIKSGAIARELNFVSHHVRNKLDELKRIELDRLRKLAKKEQQLDDDRRWRTLHNTEPLDGDLNHIDHNNPHSFEAEDLQKLIIAATRDLDDLDEKRRDDFKKYEMEKELEYRESLNNMTDTQRAEAETKHQQMIDKHKKHEPIHHPGSKQQFQQVWTETDHMPQNEFDPKVFFAMHDVNGDGFWDHQEVEALLTVEVKKMYDPKNEEDDPNEMMEEYHRMREHIYREADSNKDGLISKKEFLDFTHRADFERDEGWKGIDENKVYNDDDLKHYQEQRQRNFQRMDQYGAYQLPNEYYGYHPDMGQGQHPPQYYPQQYHDQQHPDQQQFQQHPQQQQFQQHPQQQFQQHPQQQFQQHPQQQLHPQQMQQQFQQMSPQHVPQHIPQQLPQQQIPHVPQMQVPQQHVPQQLPPQNLPQHQLPQQNVPQQQQQQQHQQQQQQQQQQHQQQLPPQHVPSQQLPPAQQPPQMPQHQQQQHLNQQIPQQQQQLPPQNVPHH